MESFKAVVSATYSLFQLHFSVFDFDITLWQVFLFFTLAGVALQFFYRIMD